VAESVLNPNYPLRSPFTKKRDYHWIRESFAGAGQASFFTPPSQDPDMFERLTNVQPIATGNLQRRWGYALFNSPGTAYQRAYEYQNETTLARYLLFAQSGNVLALNEDGTVFQTSIAAPTALPRVLVSRGSAFVYDGVQADLKKWTPPTTITNWGITGPATAITVGGVGSGLVTLVSGRNYFVVFQNSSTAQLSDLGPVSATTGPTNLNNIPLSAIPSSPDSQVDTKIILATADGGDQTTLYELATIANATTTYTDNTPEETLLASNIFQENDALGVAHGVADNTPPPNGTFALKHRGRLYMLSGSTLAFSKNLDDLTTSTGTVCGRYEECWPAFNTLDISTGAEIGSGLISDGTNLYIGTERHIRTLQGSGPSDFTEPEVLFNHVGLINQESAKVVYIEGSPAGAIWLTPDLRIIQSDFNTYRDIGTPIQDVLNSINASVATTVATSEMFSTNAFDLYILAIPTGVNTSNDTLCVYDLRAQKWLVWNPTDLTTFLLGNIEANGTPQLVFGTPGGTFYVYGSGLVQDRVNNTPVNFPVSARTSWLNLGDATSTKILQSVEMITGDTALTLKVEGASTDLDFNSPRLIANNSQVIRGPFNRYLLPLAGKVSKDRYFRFSFTSNNTASNILSMYKVWFLPSNRI
jgi:hypothetical protein